MVSQKQSKEFRRNSINERLKTMNVLKWIEDQIAEKANKEVETMSIVDVVNHINAHRGSLWAGADLLGCSDGLLRDILDEHGYEPFPMLDSKINTVYWEWRKL